jgi:ribosome biogenesis GTPase
VNRDFNINRLERYLTICNTSKVEPIIILSKIDLIDQPILDKFINEIKVRIKNVSVIAISNQSLVGLDELKAIIKKGKTYCLLGSSGVGKSTLLNQLSGKKLMNTGAISESVDRGKHITSHRELIILENGGILIDNPGMREIGITNTSDGLEITFDEIVELSQSCKFNDCTHTTEQGCAILDAVENKKIDPDSYENFQKMERERSFFESTKEEKKKKDKDFGKMIKNVKKLRKRNKY